MKGPERALWVGLGALAYPLGVLAAHIITRQPLLHPDTRRKAPTCVARYS